MNILMLDNYDSFTYNLVQIVEEILDQEIAVFRNDAISPEAINNYDAIILSPGPGLPSEAGIMPEVIKRYAPEKPILGVCLGHQAIGEAFGARLQNLDKVYHGVATPMYLSGESDPVLEGLTHPFEAGRYHSWVVDGATLPDSLVVTATDREGRIMAMRHRSYPTYGLQFHPESIMTPDGRQMLTNFLEVCRLQQEKSSLV